MTIKHIDHWAYQPSSLSTIGPIDHQAYRPSSPLTTEPIDLRSSFATFKPFGLFLFQMFLELFFTPKKTPPKVKNSKPDKRDIFFGQPVYLHHFSIFHQKCICIWSHCFTFCPISFSSYFPISESEVFILNFMQSSTHITIISGFNLFPAISHARLFSHSSIVHNNSSPLAARQ